MNTYKVKMYDGETDEFFYVQLEAESEQEVLYKVQVDFPYARTVWTIKL